jgi:hypothetical protein
MRIPSNARAWQSYRAYSAELVAADERSHCVMAC